MKELLLVAVVLACPLMMVLMMRGHRHGGHVGAHGQGHDGVPDEVSTEDLRRRRADLDRLIDERERSNGEVTRAGRS